MGKIKVTDNEPMTFSSKRYIEILNVPPWVTSPAHSTGRGVAGSVIGPQFRQASDSEGITPAGGLKFVNGPGFTPGSPNVFSLAL